MKLSEVRTLLDGNGIPYTLTVDPGQKGTRAAKEKDAVCILTISNPHHIKNIEIVFEAASDNPEFYDLGFGGYLYELFGWLEEALPQTILDEIQNIICGRSWVVHSTDAKTGKWVYSGLFCDAQEDEWNEMDQFYKTVTKIKEPKSLWKKLIRKTEIYEIFNWQNYEKIIK